MKNYWLEKSNNEFQIFDILADKVEEKIMQVLHSSRRPEIVILNISNENRQLVFGITEVKFYDQTIAMATCFNQLLFFFSSDFAK